jgi:general secretion pathway protein K
LLAVLWILAALSLIAAALSAQIRTEARIASNMTENARARALADAGVSRAIFAWLDPDPQTQWRADGQEHSFPFDGGEIRVVITDEAGKVDINEAPAELIAGLLAELGADARMTTQLVDAIEDWKDPDDLRRPSGAEQDDYRRARLPYGPRNGRFEVVDELRLVLGMTQPLFAQMQPFITVHAQSGRINPLAAPAPVIRSLPGVSVEVSSMFLAARRLAEAGATASLPSLAGAEQFLTFAPGRAVTIRSTASTGSGATFVREAVVAPVRSPAISYRTVGWRRGIDTQLEDDRRSRD